MTVVLVIIVLLVINALCVAAEFAVIKAKEGRLRAAAEGCDVLHASFPAVR